MSSSSHINPLPAVQDSFSDSELVKLSERLKPSTWFIKVSYKNKGVPFEAYGTGFALKVDKKTLGKSIKESAVVLMTCAHIFPQAPHKIEVRSFEGKSFVDAERLYMKNNWDTSLLLVKDGNCSNCVEFSNDGSISNCQTLLQIGHSEDLIWSVFVGRAAYPCVNYLPPSGPFRSCADYLRLDLNETPDCRIMGHIWNKTYFDAHDKERLTFEKNLYPMIQVIQCSGFQCRNGCSGGPVFNTEGQVVGMLVGEFDGCQTAIHVSFLKEFLKINSIDSPSSSQVNETVKQLSGGGEDALRGLKRKEGPDM